MEAKNKSDFSKLVLNWAVVLRADVKDIEKIKNFILSLPEVDTIYQCLDAGHLIIVRENAKGDSKT